jgi:hypothetical protein
LASQTWALVTLFNYRACSEAKEKEKEKECREERGAHHAPPRRHGAIEDDDDDLFRPVASRSRAAQEEEEEAAAAGVEEGEEWDDNAEDVARGKVGEEELARWDNVAVLAAVRSKFVNDETDAATIKAAFYAGGGGSGGGEEDGGDVAYGDFEDLETGEVFAAGLGGVGVSKHIDSGDEEDEERRGKGKPKSAKNSRILGEEDEDGGIKVGGDEGGGDVSKSDAEKQAELMKEKLEKRKRFDSVYDGIEENEELVKVRALRS